MLRVQTLLEQSQTHADGVGLVAKAEAVAEAAKLDVVQVGITRSLHTLVALKRELL